MRSARRPPPRIAPRARRPGAAWRSVASIETIPGQLPRCCGVRARQRTPGTSRGSQRVPHVNCLRRQREPRFGHRVVGRGREQPRRFSRVLRAPRQCRCHPHRWTRWPLGAGRWRDRGASSAAKNLTPQPPSLGGKGESVLPPLPFQGRGRGRGSSRPGEFPDTSRGRPGPAWPHRSPHRCTRHPPR